MKEYSEKEIRILDTAAELFASNPFHKVLLSDVARIASVGKGTVYLYFKNKDDLYLAVLFRGFSTLVDRLRKTVAQETMSPEEQISEIVQEIVHHLFAKATNVELMGAVVTCPKPDEWQEMRVELWQLIESVIQRGVSQGVFKDGNPRLTAQFITGMIRSAGLFTPTGETEATICRHACDFIMKALKKDTATLT